MAANKTQEEVVKQAGPVMVQLPADHLQEVLNVLQQMPFAQVHKVIGLVMQATPVE